MTLKRYLSITMIFVMLICSFNVYAADEVITETTQELVESKEYNESAVSAEEIFTPDEISTINLNETSGTLESGNISWSFSSNGMLTLTGKGDMDNFAESGAPWNTQKQYIRFIYVSAGITSIGDYAFNDLSNATSVYIPSSVISIGTGAFSRCSSLKELSLTENLRTIGDNAFEYCSGLTNVDIPRRVSSIGVAAFSNCGKLKEFTVNRNNVYFSAKDGVLFNYSKTTLICYPCGMNNSSYSVPEGVTTIGQFAFENCSELTEIILPQTLITIKSGAFYDCESIKKFDIPASVTDIAQDAFLYGCSSLEEINVAYGNTVYSSDKGVLFNKDKTMLIRYPVMCELPCVWGEYVLPETVKTIGQEAFFECQTVAGLYIHGIVEKIEMAAFLYFDSLEYIVFGGTQKNWERVEKDIFNDKLQSVEIQFMEGVLEKEFQAKVGVTYYIEDFVDLQGNEDVLKTLVVSSSDPTVASVDSTKMVAISVGETIITAIAIKDGVTYAASVKVIVTNDVTDGKEGTFTLVSGETIDLKSALDVPDEFLNSLTWNSSDKKVATVVDGVVTALDKGTAVIIATVNISGKPSYNIHCEITVEPKYTDEKYFVFRNGTITSYTGPDSEVIIPPTIGGVDVKTIGAYAFYNRNHITKIELPDTVTRIENYAFYYCRSLSNINLNEGITYIGSNAFYYCQSLVKVTLPSTITSTGTSLFYGCTRLSSVEYAYGTKIITQALKGSYVKKVTIPSTVTTIQDYAFNNCSRLESITLPNSVTSIGFRAFENCYNLKSAVIGNNVTSMGSYAFASCTKLSSVKIGSKLTTLNDYAFYNCYSLTSIVIPGNIKTIGTDAFAYCSSLKNVTLSSGVTDIYSRAFIYTAIQSLVIPDSVKTIGTYAFYYTPISRLTLGTGVTTINSYAFANSRIAKLVIPDNVKYIYSYAFEGCHYLDEVVIGDGVERVYSYTFKNCENLKTIQLGSNVKTLEYYCFSYTGLTSIVIPDTVTTIGEGIFTGCKNLTSVTVGKGVSYIPSRFLYGCTSVKTVVLSEGLEEIYEYAFNNCTALENIIIPSTVTMIGSYAFYNCTSLEEIKIPENVTIINGYVFYKCTSLKGLELGSRLISIGNNAFAYCSSLKNVVIPDSVYSIGSNAFQYCFGIENVDLGEGLNKIGNYAFYRNSALKKLEIPNKVESIGDYAFYDCVKLEQITFGSGLKTIGRNSFYNCGAITTLVLPINVSMVNDYAFAYCKNLENVQIENGLCTFGYNVFYGCDKLDNSTECTGSYKALNEEAIGYFPMQIAYDITGSGLTDKKITVNLPESSYLVQGSLELDGELYTNYVEEERAYYYNRVIINLEKDSGVFTFYIKPTTYGSMSTSANISVKKYGNTITKQLGQVYLSMPEITISAADTTGKSEVIVSGTAIPKTNINFYVDGIKQKTIRSQSNGTYKTYIMIDEPENYREYVVTAEIVDGDSTYTANTVVTYLSNTPDLEELKYYYGRIGRTKSEYTLYNISSGVTRPIIQFGNPSAVRNYGNGYEYFFTVDVSQTDLIDKVYVVSTRDNKKEYLEAKWDSYSQKYVTSGYFANDCNYIPGVLTIEYTKIGEFEKADVSDVGAYLGFADDSFVSSVTDYTTTTYSAQVEVAEALREYFGTDISIISETVERDYTQITLEDLMNNEVDNYSYLYVKDDKNYVISYDLGDLSNAIIYIHDISKGFQTTYVMSFADVDDDGTENSISVKDILERTDEYSSKLLNAYNINFNIDEISEGLKLAGLKAEEMNIAQPKAEELEINKQMFVLTSVVLSVSSVDEISAPAYVLEYMLGVIENDAEYFRNLKLLNIFRIGTECKIRWKLDPSGYVYEGVTDNRLEGVTATAYFVDHSDVPLKPDGTKDIENVDPSNIVVWDATEYEQENPIITGANGEYRWDVPEGYWRVKYEKEGYETAYSDWMPVLPAHTDVNIELVSKSAPKVEKIYLTSEYMTVTFDKYMKPDTVNNVTIGEAEYTIEYDDTKKDLEGNVLANEYTFKFVTALPAGEECNVSISGAEAYSGLAMVDYSSTHATPGEPLPTSLILESVTDSGNTVSVNYLNNSGDLMTFNIICATYDENDALIDAKILTIENMASGTRVDRAFTFISPWSSYRVFTWSTETMMKSVIPNYDSKNAVK